MTIDEMERQVREMSQAERLQYIEEQLQKLREVVKQLEPRAADHPEVYEQTQQQIRTLEEKVRAERARMQQGNEPPQRKEAHDHPKKNYYHPKNKYLPHMIYSFQVLTKELWEMNEYINRTSNIPESEKLELKNGMAHINHMIKYSVIPQFIHRLLEDEEKGGDVPFERIDRDDGGKELVIGDADNPIAYICSMEALTPENRKKIGMKSELDLKQLASVTLDDALSVMNRYSDCAGQIFSAATRDYIIYFDGVYIPHDGVEGLTQTLTNAFVSGAMKEKPQDFIEMNLSGKYATSNFICNIQNAETAQGFADYLNQNIQYPCSVQNGKLYIADNEVEHVKIIANFSKVNGDYESHKGLGYHLKLQELKLDYKVQGGYINTETGVSPDMDENFSKVFELYLEEQGRWEKLQETERKIERRGGIGNVPVSYRPDGTVFYHLD